MLIKRKKKVIKDGGPGWNSISKEESKVIEKKFAEETEDKPGEKTSVTVGKAVAGAGLGLGAGYGIKTGIKKHLLKSVDSEHSKNIKSIADKAAANKNVINKEIAEKTSKINESYQRSLKEGGPNWKRFLTGKVSKGELKRRVDGELNTVSKEGNRRLDKVSQWAQGKTGAADRLHKTKVANISKKMGKVGKGLMIGGALAGTGIALASSYRNKKKNEKQR